MERDHPRIDRVLEHTSLRSLYGRFFEGKLPPLHEARYCKRERNESHETN